MKQNVIPFPKDRVSEATARDELAKVLRWPKKQYLALQFNGMWWEWQWVSSPTS